MNIGTGSSERQVYIGGEYVPENEARISIFDHVVLYGDAVYDTACAWGGKVFKLDAHVDRLFESAHALKIEVPLDKAGVKEVVLEVMRRNKLDDAYIKILVTRGVGPMPLLSPYNCAPNLIAFAIPYLSLIDSGRTARRYSGWNIINAPDSIRVPGFKDQMLQLLESHPDAHGGE